jgi:DNA-binding response OmpR family regulator
MSQKLLIADADADLRQIFSEYFVRQGFEVECAASGLECLEKFERFNPDIAVLDVEIPWGGGDGVVAWLREKREYEIPIVLISTTDFVDNEAPVIQNLRKPFALAELTDFFAKSPKELDCKCNVSAMRVRTNYATT